MPNTPTPADRIREKLDAGTLPSQDPTKVWTGRGRGNLCAACDQVILPPEVEFEAQYKRGAVRFHMGCSGLWEAERRRRGTDVA